jgi:hypothetical protein
LANRVPDEIALSLFSDCHRFSLKRGFWGEISGINMICHSRKGKRANFIGLVGCLKKQVKRKTFVTTREFWQTGEPIGWKKKNFEIAMKVSNQNGALRGTQKGSHQDYSGVGDAAILRTGYTRIARQIADRRIILAGYRLADLLKRLFNN